MLTLTISMWYELLSSSGSILLQCELSSRGRHFSIFILLFYLIIWIALLIFFLLKIWLIYKTFLVWANSNSMNQRHSDKDLGRPLWVLATKTPANKIISKYGIITHWIRANFQCLRDIPMLGSCHTIENFKKHIPKKQYIFANTPY